MVIFKDDMMIKSKQGLSDKDKLYVFLAIIAMLMFYGSIPATVLAEDTFYLWFLLAWVGYMYRSHCSNKSTKFISGLTPINSVYSAVQNSIL